MPSITNNQLTENQSQAFIRLNGQVQPLGLMLEDVSRPGVDGHAFRKIAKQAKPFEMLGSLDVDEVADIYATFGSLVARFKGAIVSVIDNLGAQHNDLVCLDVERLDGFQLLAAVGGISVDKGAYLLVRFVLQSTKP